MEILTEEQGRKAIGIFHGEAKVGEILGGFTQITLSPSDFSSPVSLQMALSRIYESMMKTLEQGPKKKYVAEIRFTDSLGNPVVFAVDLVEKPPPFSKRQLKARVMVEVFEEEFEER
ncbi:MAG TPA: hypothetical protein ENF82_00070 [Candidatus Methanomethylia archaeon]|nr:hypothetical protein [Candidatus Methanomethylicia archaeon]